MKAAQGKEEPPGHKGTNKSKRDALGSVFDESDVKVNQQSKMRHLRPSLVSWSSSAGNDGIGGLMVKDEPPSH
jgi:hypothetical protein